MASANRLKEYIVIKSIGKGSYGEVFLVKKRRERKQYVMKNIKLSADNAKERSAATQEASLLSQLRHPNIVSYHESFQDEHGVLHIIMGYCEGGDLCTRLKSYRGILLSEHQVVEWFVQIALALQYLHDRKIMHRDLKTQNIFLSRNDIIKVGDLGIARVLEGSLDLASTVVGTPYYMSPELFANKPYDYKSDVWALGCCVYEMATLSLAFSAKNISALMYKILQGKVPPLPSCFSHDLNDMVCRMLSQEAMQRPSVPQILRTEYVRKHIREFLEKTAMKKVKRDKTHQECSPQTKSENGLRSHSDSAVIKPQDYKSKRHLPPLTTPLIKPSPELSSARQKRRKDKQETRGRVILRSRSGSSIQDKPISIPDRSPPPHEIKGMVVDETDSGGSGKEEDEVISIMDNTLHLPEPIKPHPPPNENGWHISRGCGQLNERMVAIKRDCLSVLGEEIVSKALYILETIDQDDIIQEEMSKLLGEEKCESFLLKLQQLKLYEETSQ